MKFVRLSQIASALLALALPIAILADLNQTVTLLPNTSLNLDTGAVVSSGGDLLWNGVTLLPPGTAKVVVTGLTPSSVFPTLSQQAVVAFAPQASSSPIPSASLNPGTILAAFTNAGHTAKVMVLGNSANSLKLQFTTFGVNSVTTVPTITNVLNNSSEIPAGFSNSGIAQGSLFKVLGSTLAEDGDASLHDSQAAGGLPVTLNGASISVTVNGVTKQPSLYYATPSQIDGVLPADTPIGAGTLTVTHNGTPSSTFPIQVVLAAPGITTFNGSGVAQDASRLTDAISGLVTYTNSASPGAILLLWGTGYGPTGNSDTKYDASAHQTSVPYTIYIGGVKASIGYQGNSVYPGVGVFGVTIPQNVPTGCAVPLAAVATLPDGSTSVSNIVTIPIHSGGGVCFDAQTGLSGDQFSRLTGQSAVNTGIVSVIQSSAPNGTSLSTSNNATAVFQQYVGSSYHPDASGSLGSCLLTQTVSGSAPTPGPLTAGPISVTGSDGAPVTLNTLPQSPGIYRATLSSIPSTGGAFVFSAGAGSQVGAFTATVNFPSPLLSWSNQSSAATVTRNQGLSITWTGGAPGSYITITGTSSVGTLTGSYTCTAPQSAGQFTVPAYILMGLPSGSGSTTVSNSGTSTPFPPTNGLDYGTAVGIVSFTASSTYN